MLIDKRRVLDCVLWCVLAIGLAFSFTVLLGASGVRAQHNHAAGHDV